MASYTETVEVDLSPEEALEACALALQGTKLKQKPSPVAPFFAAEPFNILGMSWPVRIQADVTSTATGSSVQLTANSFGFGRNTRQCRKLTQHVAAGLRDYAARTSAASPA